MLLHHVRAHWSAALELFRLLLKRLEVIVLNSKLFVVSGLEVVFDVDRVVLFVDDLMLDVYNIITNQLRR